jgi:hypothetical protein
MLGLLFGCWIATLAMDVYATYHYDRRTQRLAERLTEIDERLQDRRANPVVAPRPHRRSDQVLVRD